VRSVDGTPQVFVLSLNGGEAYQLTDTPHGATRPQWSPSGDRLLFASPVPESEIRRRSDRRPPVARPGRSPQDTIRRVPPDTILVLRHARTLDPVDTLALGPDGRLAPAPDTTRRPRTPGGASVPDSLRRLPIDSLRTLPSDSLRTVFERLRMLPDTTLVPVPPDTAATPDGDLLQTRRWLDQNRPRREAQVFTRLDPGGQDGLHPTSTYRHYFLVDVPDGIASGTPPRPPARPVTRGYRSYHGATWMPGGTQIVVSAPPSTTDVPDRLQDRNLYVVDLRPYRLQQLLDIDGYVLTNPHVTADGTTLAFRAQDRATRSYAHAQIGLFELDGRSNPQLITENFDHDVASLRWSPDGWYLYATAPTRGGRPLYRFAPFARGDTAAARGQPSLADEFATSRDTFALDSSMVRTARYTQVLDDNRSVQALDVTDSKAVYAVAGPQTPSALYTNTISFNNERPLATPNADWVTTRSLAPTEWVTAQHEDVSVTGRLTRPLNRVDSLRYPLVVVPRGGPAPLDASSPIPAWVERHFLAGRGYAVLEVWPRGSAGFGETFRRRNYQDWGPGPAGDVIAVADSVAARTGIDTTRQALAGRSYGAYLTTWLLGHTDRFQAAVAQSGVYDLISFFGDGDAWPLIPEQFGGFPWEPAAAPPPDLFIQPPAEPLLSVGLLPALDTTMAPRTALRRNAPMTSAHRIETPLLLTHGGADHRTGTGQAEMLFRRLQILDRPVEYVRYPQAGHTFRRSARPAQRLDRLVRVREFLERFAPSGGRLPRSNTPAP
jgi:dipeptidyl aminopeptidase/acylaminoacyl peptidase